MVIFVLCLGNFSFTKFNFNPLAPRISKMLQMPKMRNSILLNPCYRSWTDVVTLYNDPIEWSRNLKWVSYVQEIRRVVLWLKVNLMDACKVTLWFRVPELLKMIQKVHKGHLEHVWMIKHTGLVQSLGIGMFMQNLECWDFWNVILRNWF